MRVSPGCQNCYAEALDKRVGGLKDVDGVKRLTFGAHGHRVRTSAKNWREPERWNREATAARKRAKVFCASMADVFELPPDLDGATDTSPWLLELLELVATTPALDWLLLTKRPDNINARLLAAINMFPSMPGCERGMKLADHWLDGHPPENVWLGTTAEDQQRCDERLGELLDVPAAVHFLSCEPLLEPLSLGYAYGANLHRKGHTLDWLIVGGESGPGARPFHLEWARDLLAQARGSSIAPFVKQLGARASDPENGIAGRSLQVPADAAALVSRRLTDPAGGDPTEWPEDLRVREFPR